MVPRNSTKYATTRADQRVKKYHVPHTSSTWCISIPVRQGTVRQYNITTPVQQCPSNKPVHPIERTLGNQRCTSTTENSVYQLPVHQ